MANPVNAGDKPLVAERVADAAAAAPAPAPAPSAERPPAEAGAAAAAAPAVESPAAAPAAGAAATVPEVKPTLLQQLGADGKVVEPDKPKGAADKPAGEIDKPKGDADKEKPADVKPADGDKDAAKPDGDKKPAEPAKDGTDKKPVEAVRPEPVDYAKEVKLPDVLKADDKAFSDFTAILNDGDVRLPPAAAQKLVDLHASAMQQYADHLAREQVRIFNETRAGWLKSLMADEVLGGAGHQTAMGVVARMRDQFVPESDRAEFDAFLQATGAGDHPAFHRMLHRVGRMFDEPPLPPDNAKPPPDIGRPQGRRGVLYDHPRSANNRASG